MNRLKIFVAQNSTFIALLVLIVFFAVMHPRFFTFNNGQTIILQIAELGLIAFNQDFVAKNEEAVVRFMAGYLKAARLLDKGGWKDDKILDIVAKYTGTERDALRGIPYTVRSEDGAIDMASVREQEEFFRKRGTLEYKGQAKIDAVYRLDLLKRANELVASKP